ncbi:MAG: hypothetical protein KKD75_00460 [Nanoarchaeota archaeon]|nr:hypothetical protein [Nanoarchaeota archaeon]MBU1632627.1 hypothetical protein [Nanoarchaeota archaeon]MBU1876550.1 hypothetical protein [Nanoarchaeota archaeon]
MTNEIKDNDYEALAKLYSSFFTTHNIFQKSEDEVISYLKESSSKHKLIIFKDNDEVKGALFLVNFGTAENGLHKRWKFRHFAFTSEEIATDLLLEAEKTIQNASKTAKIELNITETEESIDFYKQHGYEQEGELKNHFRWGETCFVLAKSFSS